MEKTYRPDESDRLLLHLPALQHRSPVDPGLFFISGLLDRLDLTATTPVSEQERPGYPPYHPRKVVQLLR